MTMIITSNALKNKFTLNAEVKDTKQYNGEFMLQYEWAEEENGNIIDLIDKYKK